MSSGSGGIGSTLTGGIQDIAAVLPLLGTEQCSVQVSSALTRGYLYAASSSISIFGSLGVVSAGFKTLLACSSFGCIEGARILENMGFEPQGENLSLIMIETGKGKNTGSYIIDTRMDELIKDFNIDKNRIIEVSHKSAAWNFKMIATTALMSTCSITPYIYLNMGANTLNTTTTWIFPVLRAAGGFITATHIQLLLQRRITTLSRQYLVKRVSDVDSEAADGDTKKHEKDPLTWLLLFFLLIGLVGSVVGYVGCFSVVQSSTSNIGPVSWLCLEIGLSLIRLIIWACNPTGDDAPPLEIILKLDKYEHKPLPTCNKDNEDILRYKVLPLTRARDFLKIITSFAGLIEPFSNPDLSLYYTLTRKRPSKESVPADMHMNRDNEPENAENRELGESILYITVFDHKERTTRVYTRDNQMDTFYSTKSDAPIVDVGHFLHEVEIDIKIDLDDDPVSSDRNSLDSLRKHHQSILGQIHYRLGASDVTRYRLGASDITRYAIENSWTMKVGNTISPLQRGKGNRNIWERVVKKGKEKERSEESLVICDYFKHSSIERERRLLDEKRVKWIARRMEMITKEMKERFQSEKGVEYRVDKQTAEKKPVTKLPAAMEQLLLEEQVMMELLLLYEVTEWEKLFWKRMKDLLDQIGNDREREESKIRLTREWKANCWKRLTSQMHAAENRLADLKDYNKDILDSVIKWWVSSIRRFFEGVESRTSISLKEHIQSRIDRHERLFPLYEIRQRMENEMEDIEFRLKRGSELGRTGRFDQFWDDDALFDCRYSRSKWLRLRRSVLNAPIEIYSHALQRNKNIIHFTFNPDFDVTRFPFSDLPWITSISSSDLFGLPAIHHGPIFIKSTNNGLITFAKENRLKLDPSSTYIFTDADWFDIVSSDKLGNDARILISFVAPTSDQRLILRLKHSGREDGPLGVTLGSTIIQLNPSSKSSLTVDDITLYPTSGPSESDHLSFKPGRNDIVIKFSGTDWRHGHILHDIELFDETSLEDPRNQIIIAD